MKDKVFLDTNILIYAYSSDELSKRTIVENLLNKHIEIVISTQTVNEFINVMTKKKKLDYKQVYSVVSELFSVFSVELIDATVIHKGIDIANKYHYSYWDSLMVASAIISNCSILYSEDMHHQHLFENHLIMINPFK